MPKTPLSPTIAPAQKFIYTLTLPVRIDDINYGQHLAATAVPKLLQQARLKFFLSQGFTEANVGGMGILIVDLYVRYLCESFFDEQLQIEFGIKSMENLDVTLAYRITNQTQAKPMAVAKERMLFYDYANKKVVKIPTVFRDAVQRMEQSL